jgi:hypothetical protein
VKNRIPRPIKAVPTKTKEIKISFLSSPTQKLYPLPLLISGLKEAIEAQSKPMGLTENNMKIERLKTNHTLRILPDESLLPKTFYKSHSPDILAIR